jgi:hypothetical protein
LVAAGAAAVVLVVAAGLPVVAQDPPAEVDEAGARAEPYEGVVPGSGHAPPRDRAVRRHEQNDGAAILSWIGYQPRADGGSRFFLQLSHEVPYRGQSSPGRFELVLPNTRVHLRNTLRPLETRFFDTPVLRADAKRRGHDMVVVFTLRADVTPSLSAGEAQNGYRFVYVDWPAGDYAPEPGPVPGAPPPAATEEGEGSTNIRVYQGRD